MTGKEGEGTSPRPEDSPLEFRIGERLRAQGLTLAVAESCTGGLICHRITSVPGSSDYFERGAVAYSNRAKMDWLGVEADVIERHGAVSRPCAEAMARGIRRRAGTDLGLSVTGIAGPGGGSREKPVGTVYIGFAAKEGTYAWRFRFSGTRGEIQTASAEAALEWVWRYLNRDPFFHRL